MFTDSVGQMPDVLAVREIWGGDSDVLVNGGLFTTTSVNITPTMDFVGSRPCFVFTGAAANDAWQGQVTAGIIQGIAGKTIRLKAGIRMTATDAEFSFGLAAPDTTVIASDPTDFIMVEKLTGVTVPQIELRKASGTKEVASGIITLAANKWYDFELVAMRDASTAGAGVVMLFAGEDLGKGGQMTFKQRYFVSSQFPDTVDLAPYFAMRVQSASSVCLSHFGWLFER